MLGATFVCPLPAFAALGQTVGSIDTDASQLKATAHSATQQSGYTVHLLTLPTGGTVREFVSAGGVVFGVAWQGPTLPDLKTLLGASFEPYVAATATRTAIPGVSTDDLVVESGGHLRAFAGHAYLPKSVPSGVDTGAIQ